jgi:hypothetical protein
MNIINTSLPRRVTQGYWIAVREQLHQRLQISDATSRYVVTEYQKLLVKAKCGDDVFHESIEVTTNGIIDGGYATAAIAKMKKNRSVLPRRTKQILKHRGSLIKTKKTRSTVSGH